MVTGKSHSKFKKFRSVPQTFARNFLSLNERAPSSLSRSKSGGGGGSRERETMASGGTGWGGGGEGIADGRARAGLQEK